jgi:hypothetical protein
MGTPATSTNYKLLRDLWPQKSIYEVLFEVSPTVGLMPKDTSFYERKRYIDVGYGAPQGVGPLFGQAKAAKTPSKAGEFAITPVTYYGLVSLEGRLMRQAKGDKALIVKPLARESRNVIWQWKRDLSALIHGNGGGAIGQIDTTTTISAANQTVTLLDKTKIRFFESGMTLNSSTADGTSGAVKPGQLTIASVDIVAGTFTVNEAGLTVGIPTIAQSDYLFRAGVFGNVVTGIGGWMPASAPSGGESFFGQDRSLANYRLAGLRLTATGKSPREAALYAAKEVYKNGGKPDTYILSVDDWYNLSLELQSAGALLMTKAPSAPIGKYNFGLAYDAIQIMGPAGPIKCVADPDCPVGTAWMLTLDTWVLASTGELVAFIEGGGGPNNLMMENDADAWEARLVGDFQLYCEAPGWNARVTL